MTSVTTAAATPATSPATAAISTGAFTGRTLAVGLFCWECEGEPRLAVPAHQLQAPVHALGQLAGDGQAEPAAGRGRRLAPVEPLEQVLGRVRADAAAVVRHLQADAAVLGRNRHPHLCPVGVVPYGVVEQRPADLLHALLVTDRVRQVGGRLHERDAAAVAGCQPPE